LLPALTLDHAHLLDSDLQIYRGENVSTRSFPPACS
jgi:hypothetical protein